MKIHSGDLTVRKVYGEMRWMASFRSQRYCSYGPSPAVAINAACDRLVRDEGRRANAHYNISPAVDVPLPDISKAGQA